MAARAELKLLDRDEHYLIGLWHNVFVTMWRGTATLEAMKRVGFHHREVDKTFVDGYCAIAVMGMTSIRLDPEVRAEATRLSEDPGQNMKAIAQVILGTGLGAATTRMIASGLLLVRKRKVPTKFFNDVPAGARWLEPYFTSVTGGAKPTPEDLVLVLDQAWR
jgi:hypothetical protein